ncbi:hypothetical protein FN846DRAFT_905811 [Sphaerosporella brunnea]|uniref:Uncharacterized protein n=1 Tax=Sphaerosporella brunnea TaxID=1250544 RepID=A0A5J5F083_9PEZI|nr:hypothetical protein FN846DRAFT_905811 [Sphaerosporella brunnea]
MSTHSDGEDSQMHDNASLPSSTPSTPPASSHIPHHAVAGTVSPPNSQPHVAPGLGAAVMQQGPPPGPSWAGKRAVEEAENAREKCSDRGFSLRWVGDPLDESDMWKV